LPEGPVSLTGMAENRAPTIYDVARAAGVAPSTVSRAFARPERVSATTAERIRAVAAELGFRTNPLARALPTGRTLLIALVVPDIANPFCAEVVRGAQAAAVRSGYAMVLTSPDDGPAVDRALSLVDGVVVASSGLPDAAVLKIAAQRPVVALDRVVPGVPSVITDNPRGMRQTVAHLAALGHEHVTYVAGPADSWADAARRRSLRQAGTEQGIQSRRVGPYPPTVAGGVAAADDVLRQPTTAVIAYNDLMAMGLVRALSARGLRVPDDLSVVGFDGIFAAELAMPALTTVAAPLRLLGETAVRHLLAVIGGAAPSLGTPLTLPASLVVRTSTSRRRRTGMLVSSTWNPSMFDALQ
jgi:DNA-binding LacI/PurR family transcriptional regulator